MNSLIGNCYMFALYTHLIANQLKIYCFVKNSLIRKLCCVIGIDILDKCAWESEF